MPRDGSGNYTRPVNSVDPAVSNTTISSTDFNQLTADLAAEMTDSLDRSGKGAMLAALAMGGFAINNLGSPSVASDAARLDTVTGVTLAGDVTGATGSTVVANVAGGKVTGLAAGAFAPAGKVGQVVSASNTIAQSSGVTQNVTSLALTAGNWLLFATYNTGPAGGTQTSGINVVISTVIQSLGSTVGNAYSAFNAASGTVLGTGQQFNASVGPAVATISTPTTYYLNTNISFAGGSMNIGGVITAVRLG